MAPKTAWPEVFLLEQPWRPILSHAAAPVQIARRWSADLPSSSIQRKICGKTCKIVLESQALACYVTHRNKPGFMR
jgi:hypothetical protein